MKTPDKAERQGRLLSDLKWKKIERASGLPSEARSSIESVVRTYQTLQETGFALMPAKIKEKLRRLRSQARELLEGFEEVLGHDDVYLALVPVGPNEWHPRNFEQREKLAEHRRTEKVRADLNALIDWLDQSVQALPGRKPGPPADRAEYVYVFVEMFGTEFHYYTNKRLTRSKHLEMMEEIFRIIDREVGPGTIETAMKRVGAARRSRRGLLPGSRF
jgi:hypothetical protein